MYFYSFNYPDEPIFTFYLNKDRFEYLYLLNDTEILATYYYPKKTLSYYTNYDDILYNVGTFVIKNSVGQVILHQGNISSIRGNNITFTQYVSDDEVLKIGEKFTVEYEFKKKGGLLDTKHMFVEIQPWEMQFYNSYYPFSGGSIIAPLYYNFSANYQYQLALNYRLLEKSVHSYEFEADVSEDFNVFDLGDTSPQKYPDDSPIIVAYFINGTGSQIDFFEEDLEMIDDTKLNVSLSNYYKDRGLENEMTIYVSLFSELHNKYLNYHDLQVDLTNDNIILLNWTVAQDPDVNLMANLESSHYIYEVDQYKAMSKGKVKQVFAILNNTNSLTYYLTEDLNDPVDGWQDYDTLIMKVGFLNPDVLDYLNVSFYYDEAGEQYIGSTTISMEMVDEESGAVYIKLPDSDDFNKFTVQNNARIVFDPVFYDDEDFQGDFYGQGLPTIETIQWSSEDVEDGFLSIDLTREIFSLEQSIYVFNDMMEFIYEITDIGTRTEVLNIYDNNQNYEVEYNNITLPEIFFDTEGNMTIMRDGDILYLKYNATLEQAIGLSIEDMILQRKPYIEDHDAPVYSPLAEISLLGIHSDGNEYTTDDLYDNRNKLVAWETPLDLTPFESEYLNTYRQCVINITFEDIYSSFKVLDEDSIEHAYMTEILITSNDPRYQIVVDSLFIFEFDENATLYDSEIFDVYPNNHLVSFYFGNYSDIYSEYRILDTGSYLPLYYDDPTINETYYFDAFDSAGNWYYFDSHLFGIEEQTGVYTLSWESGFAGEYYATYEDYVDDIINYRYMNAEEVPEELAELYDYYNPHVDKFRYLYISWADQNAWEEWHTIEAPNIDISSLNVVFEWYDEVGEEYQSVPYHQSSGEFETRNIAVEIFYPYDKNTQTANFTLSQDYSSAQDLDIYKIEGIFFNEISHDFDLNDVNISETQQGTQRSILGD